MTLKGYHEGQKHDLQDDLHPVHRIHGACHGNGRHQERRGKRSFDLPCHLHFIGLMTTMSMMIESADFSRQSLRLFHVC